jgi:hypothetical protein
MGLWGLTGVFAGILSFSFSWFPEGHELALRWNGRQGKSLFGSVPLGATPFEKASAGGAYQIQQRHTCEEDSEDGDCNDER